MIFADILKSFDYKIVGGSDYCWACYGPNARFIDFESDHGYGSVIFDTTSHVVFEATVNDKDDKVKPYRYLNPDFVEAHKAEAKQKNVKHGIAWDDVKWVDLEIFDDFCEKANAIFNGKSFDDRVQVPVELDDDAFLELAKQAHKRDITINKMVELVLQLEMDRRKKESE